jgi:hypothetical protein
MTMKQNLAALAVGFALIGGIAAIAPTASADPTADSTLASTLAFSHEEERMARDLYQLFSDTYGSARPFSNITKSENQHMTAVSGLMTTYGVPDPSVGKVAGVYADPAIQQLYDTWKAQGLTSIEEAEKVGVALEQRDIADLERLIAATAQQDVKDVFARLLAGSQNHLKAFQAAVDNTTPEGMGNGPSTGNGTGMGQGRPAGSQTGQRGHSTAPMDADHDGICDVTGEPMPASGADAGQGQGMGQGQNRRGDQTGTPMGQGPRGNR